MKNKITIVFVATMILSSSIFAQNFYTGNGGRGMRLEVEKPQVENVGSDVSWIPNFVANMVSDTIAKYSAIQIVDNYNEQRVVAARVRDESAAFDESAVLDAEGFAVAQNILNIAITGKSNSYSLSFRVTDKQTLAQKASHNNANCMYADLESGKALTAAVSDLLGQLGVTLTADAKKTLSTPTTSETKTVQAQVNVARGLEAQRNGSNVEALTYYIKAMTSDKTLTRAAVATETTSNAINNGNLGEIARNKIKVMDEYAALVKETKAYLKTISPYKLIYSTNLELGTVDYKNETIDYMFYMYLCENYDYSNICKTVYKAIVEHPDSEKWDKNLVDARDFEKTINKYSGGRYGYRGFDTTVTFNLKDASGKVIAKSERKLSKNLIPPPSWNLVPYVAKFVVPIDKDVSNSTISVVSSPGINPEDIFVLEDIIKKIRFELVPVEGQTDAYQLVYPQDSIAEEMMQLLIDTRLIYYCEKPYYINEHAHIKEPYYVVHPNEIKSFLPIKYKDYKLAIEGYYTMYGKPFVPYENSPKISERFYIDTTLGSIGNGKRLLVPSIIQISDNLQKISIWEPDQWRKKKEAEAESRLTPKELFNKYFVVAEWQEKGIYSVFLRSNVDKEKASEFLYKYRWADKKRAYELIYGRSFNYNDEKYLKDIHTRDGRGSVRYDYKPDKNVMSLFPDEYQKLKPIDFDFEGFVWNFAPQMTDVFNDYVLRAAFGENRSYRTYVRSEVYKRIMDSLPRLTQDINAGEFSSEMSVHFNLIYIDESKIDKKFIDEINTSDRVKELFNEFFEVAEWEEKGIYSVLLRPDVDRNKAMQFLSDNLKDDENMISIFPDEYKNLKPVTLGYELEYNLFSKYSDYDGNVLTFAPEMTPMFNNYVLRAAKITKYRGVRAEYLYDSIERAIPSLLQKTTGRMPYLNVYIDENKIDKKYINQKDMKEQKEEQKRLEQEQKELEKKQKEEQKRLEKEAKELEKKQKEDQKRLEKEAKKRKGNNR